MKTKTLTLGEVASVTGGRVAGDATRRVSGIAPLEDAGPDDLSLLSDPRYKRAAERSAAGSLLVKDGLELEGRDSVVVADPHFALALLLPRIAEASPEPEREIAGTASVAADARIGRAVAVGPFAVVASGCSIEDGARIGAGCVLGAGVHVGPDALLHPRVVVYPGCRIGARAVVHAGAVIGSDGFGFATKGGVHHKIPQVGRVVIEDDVEIGANTTIDRGSIGDTVIGAGTKIDNLVQIGHNVRIGAGCLIVAQAGISGSTRLGPGAVIAGQSGAAGHLSIGAGAQVASKSAVYADVAAGAVVSGIPAIDHRRWRRAQAAFAGLPEMLTRLRGIEERLGALAEAPQPRLLPKAKAAQMKSGPKPRAKPRAAGKPRRSTKSKPRSSTKPPKRRSTKHGSRRAKR